jgi:membrane-associated phospholipid phosphatase
MASPEPPHVPVLPPPRFFFGVSLGAGIFFALWTWLVLNGIPIPVVDIDIPALDRKFAEHWQHWSDSHLRMRGFMVFLTDMGGIAAMTLLALMGSIWQTAIKHRALALAWFGIVIGGAILNQGFKEAIGRPRPSNPDAVVHERNNSYPSGHSMGSTVGYGMLAYAILLTQPTRRRRTVTVLLLASVIIAIGCSRIMLRAHWLSDVVAGWTIGVAWLCFCLGLIEWRRVGSMPHRELV